MPEPPSIAQYLQKAEAALKQHQFEYAVELCTHALTIQPDSAHARRLMRAIIQQQRTTNPPSMLQRLASKLSTLAPQLQAGIAVVRKDDQTACRYYEMALQREPSSVPLLAKLANVLIRLRYTESAIQTLEDILAIHPANLFALRQLGELYSSANNYDKAKQCYEAVLKSVPQDADAKRGLKNLDALGTIRQTFKPTDTP